MLSITAILNTMPKFRAVLAVTALSVFLSGCPWPFQDSSSGYHEPFEPEPVSLEDVATSEIRLSVHSTLIEEEDSVEVVVNLRTSEYAPLLLGAESTLELHVSDGQGIYYPAEVTGYEYLDAGARFKLPAPIVPIRYRVLLNRSNTEVAELFNIELNAKISTESTARNATFGNGDIFEFSWHSHDSNGSLDSVPPGWILYRLECGNPFVERDTPGSRVIIGTVGLSESRGLDTEPTVFDVDAVLGEYNISNFPCELYLERIFYLYQESNNYFLFTGSFGSKIGTADSPANNFGFSVDAKVYVVTVEGE